jgi:DNA-binding response OmpR family regulator
MPRVLVVDDDKYISEIIKCTLEPENFAVILANNGQTALNCLSQSKPDLILLDIKLPDMDGTTLLETIRKTSNIPIIMVTSVIDATAITHSLNLGADDYIRKPFLPNELIARVKAKLRRMK